MCTASENGQIDIVRLVVRSLLDHGSGIEERIANAGLCLP